MNENKQTNNIFFSLLCDFVGIYALLKSGTRFKFNAIMKGPDEI